MKIYRRLTAAILCIAMFITGCGGTKQNENHYEEGEFVSPTAYDEVTVTEGETLPTEDEKIVVNKAGPAKNTVIRDFDYDIDGDFNILIMDDGRLSFRDYDRNIGVNFPDDLEYSNTVIPGAVMLSDENNSFMVVRNVTWEIDSVYNNALPEELLENLFDEYGLGDYRLLYGEENTSCNYKTASVAGSSTRIAAANATLKSKNYQISAFATIHTSTYSDGDVHYILKIAYCPSNGKSASGIWSRNGIATLSARRSKSTSSNNNTTNTSNQNSKIKNQKVKNHDYAVDGNFEFENLSNNMFRFMDYDKRIGLKLAIGMEYSNTMLYDAVLGSDMKNGYVVARNMTSEFMDYYGGPEEFQEYLLDNYILDDFAVLYGMSESVGDIKISYSKSANTEIMCIADVRIQNKDYDIIAHTDVLAHPMTDTGNIVYGVLTRYYPYGADGHKDVRSNTRIVYLNPARG